MQPLKLHDMAEGRIVAGLIILDPVKLYQMRWQRWVSAQTTLSHNGVRSAYFGSCLDDDCISTFATSR